jgi:hypothetical protein
VALQARAPATVAVAGVVADVVPAAALVVGTLVAAGETAKRAHVPSGIVI